MSNSENIALAERTASDLIATLRSHRSGAYLHTRTTQAAAAALNAGDLRCSLLSHRSGAYLSTQTAQQAAEVLERQP